MIARLRKGAVINLFLLAGIGLLIYYATTLTERMANGPSAPRAFAAEVRGTGYCRNPASTCHLPRSVNVATLTEREATVTAVQTGGPGSPARVASRSVNVAYHRHSYPVDFRHRWILEKAHRLRTSSKLNAEHAHVQRLLRELRARYTQSLRKREAEGVDAPSRSLSDWRARQIAAAETIGREAGADPWPNCPDPIWDGAASWDDTVACENSGSWLDSPGYYRCGLQFDPMWERRFGALCP